MSKSKYDNKGLAWLRLKKWKKFQPDSSLRNKDAQLKWVRDWTEKLDNYDFTLLTFYERALFEGLCLLAGKRPLRTIPNDPTYISRALHAQPTDIPHVGHALSTLILRGFVIPINTEEFIEEDEQNLSREGEGEREREGEGSGPVSQSVSDKEADASLEDEETGFVLVDLDIAVHDLPCFTLLHDEFGREAELPEVVVRRVHTALKMLGKNEVWMQGCIQWALKHKWWSSRVVNAETFAKRLVSSTNDPDQKKFAAQYNRHVAQRRAAGAGKR